MANLSLEPVPVYIGLGSNLKHPLTQLKAALKSLGQYDCINLLRCSSFYQSRPMGPSDQPDYTNAVALLETSLPAEDLLSVMQQIELEQGRVRKSEQWGPRTLDLDMLLYGMIHIGTERLTVPHYGMKEREFVLYPLAEIAPKLVFPDGQTLQQALQDCPLNGLKKLDIGDNSA